MLCRLNSCLCLLLGVSLCALIGFLGIQQLDWPSGPARAFEHFTIMVDGGSTKTSSALMQYKLNWDANLIDSLRRTNGNKDLSDQNLANFIKITELSQCKNGGPLTEVETIQDAHALLDPCNQRYLDQIETRNFSSSSKPQARIDQDQKQGDSCNESPSSSSLATTRLYLGATAGMRTLRSVDDREAQRKISLVQQAAREKLVMQRQATRNAISVGRMEILSDEEEAAYAWISVNFQANLLKFNPTSIGPMSADSLDSLGTVEMGGSSVQMAYQIGESHPKEARPENYHSLELFGFRYPLVARSEKCLGIAQGKSRAILLMIRQILRDKIEHGKLAMRDNQVTLALDNSCWAGKDETLTRDQLEKLIGEPCMLLPLGGLDPIAQFLRDNKQLQSLKLVAKFNRGQCDAIIANLLNPQYCQANFRLCLTSQVDPSALPQNKVFLALANFNLVAKGLGLRQAAGGSRSQAEMASNLARELNYYSVDHGELEDQLSRLCQIDARDIPKSFPVKEEHASSACFTFSYIDKLLTDFYGFSPQLAKWKQLKFNLDSQGQTPIGKPVNFAWQMGMALKETSELLKSPEANYLLLANEGLGPLDSMQNFRSLLRQHKQLLIGLAIFNLVVVLAIVSTELVKGSRGKQEGSANQAPTACNDSGCHCADHFRLELVAISGGTKKPDS